MVGYGISAAIEVQFFINISEIYFSNVNEDSRQEKIQIQSVNNERVVS